MDALTKSLQRSSAVINTAQASFTREKAVAGGISGMFAGSAFASIGGDWSQQTRNRENYALFRSWVYGAVNALASEAAAQPVHIGRMGSVGEQGGLRSLNREKQENRAAKEARTASKLKAYLLHRMTENVRRKAATEELEVLAHHVLNKKLERPNPIQQRYQFVYSFIANLNLTGRAYIVRDGEDYYSLPSTWVRPDHEKGPFSRFFIVNPRVFDAAEASDPVPASQVGMAYLPNPADPMGCMSPAAAQSAAIRVDDRIQACEEKFFDQGIFPSAIVTIGTEPHPDFPRGIRPRLSPTQRRQVEGAIRKAMGGVANYGAPAIVDGLIESITRLSPTQNELGWERSEGTLKTRILSAFCVHPFILGEPVGVGGYAQTYVIMERFCDRLNTFLDLLSTLMTGLVDTEEEEEKETGLLIWWERKIPKDPSLEWSNLKFARSNGDITQNEFRAKLGLPPDEDRNEAVVSPSLMGVITQLVAQAGAGAIRQEQAQALMEAAGLPEDLAERIAGVGLPPLEPPAGAPGGPVGALGGPEGAPSPLSEEEALANASGALGEAVKELRAPLLLEVPVILDELERKYSEDQPRDDFGRWAPDTGGSFGRGEGASVGSYESYDDKIEGTQKEADREVKRADKTVERAQAVLEKAKEALVTYSKVAVSKIKGLEKSLGEVRSRIEENKAKLEASKARIAALKAQLKKRKSLEEDLDEELNNLSEITQQLYRNGQEASGILDELEELVSTKSFDPDQPRDESGEWSSEGAGGRVENDKPVGVGKGGLVEDHVAWSEHHNGPPLSIPQKATASHYQGNGYITMNGHLRQGKYESPEVKESIAILDSVMKTAAKTQESVTVYRGLAKLPEGLKSGSVFIDKGYVSTSTDKGAADKIAREAKDDIPIVMQIKIPKGKPALSMEHATGKTKYSTEREVLLPRNAKFKIERLEYMPGDKPYFVAYAKYLGSAKK